MGREQRTIIKKKKIKSKPQESHDMSLSKVVSPFFLCLAIFLSCSSPIKEEKMEELEEKDSKSSYVEYHINKKGQPEGTWKYYDYYGNMLMEIDYSSVEKSNFKVYYFSTSKKLINYQAYYYNELIYSFSFKHPDYEDKLKGAVLFKKYCEMCHEVDTDHVGPALNKGIKDISLKEGYQKLRKGLKDTRHETKYLESKVSFDSLDLIFLIKHITNNEPIYNP